MGAYAGGAALDACNVTSGHDMMTEAAIAKLFVLLGLYDDIRTVEKEMERAWCGEISEE